MKEENFELMTKQEKSEYCILPRSLRLLHDRHKMGTNESSICVHGNVFNSGDPVTHNWISRKGVLIYKEGITIEDSARIIYYRSTSGTYKCRQEYDGQEDLLFNLDGRHLFYSGFLLQYLHLMLKFHLWSTWSSSMSCPAAPRSVQLFR